MTGLDGAGVRVVLAGTGKHHAGSTLPDVPQVGHTVRALESCLVGVCGVQPDNLTTVIDPENPAELLQAVSDAAQAATDVLLVYYVGHGVVSVKGNLHLATRSSVDLDRMPGFKALRYESLVEEVRSSRARTVVVVLDCCYSARAEIPVPSGALLASAGRDELALAVDGEELTAFSAELVRALRDGIPTGPAQLNLHLVHAHLVRATERTGRPQPRLFLGGQAGALVLAANRAYRPAPTTPDPRDPPWDHACPYRGLDRFTAADADVFHGRGALVERLVIHLGQQARSGGITVVTGPSGSGKSSLLAAGVLPAITHGDLAIPGSTAWPTISLTPGDDPLTALADRLSEHLDDADAGSVRRRLAGEPHRARDLFADAAGAAGRVVVVVDQFEELFTGVVADDDQRAFVRALHSGGEPDSGAAHPAALVVLGLRSDFHGSCTRFPELVSAVQDHQVVVGPMTTAELREAITAPAAQAGLALVPGLTDRLLSDCGADLTDDSSTAYDPGALPLLSHALLATWQNRQGNVLTVDGYLEAGGVTGAVTKTADDTYDSLDALARDTAASVLPRMVDVGEDTPHDTRRSLRRDGSETPAATAVLEAFARARLVTLDGDTATLTHEALIRTWPRLREWIDGNRADRQVVQRLEADAHAWSSSGDDSLLYRGARLDAIGPQRDDITETARAFLSSARRQERRAARLRRTLISALCVLTLLVSTAAVTAFLQAREAQRQRDNAIFNQVVAHADQLAGRDVSLAAQLDLTAHRMRPGDQARYTALVTKAGAPLSIPLADHTDSVRAVAFSRDGQTLATGGSDHTVRLWDLTDPAHPTSRGTLTDHTDTVHGVAFSPDGRTLATAADRTVRLWDLTDPARAAPVGRPLADHPSGVTGVAFSPDGRTLATTGSGTVQLWDLTVPARPSVRGTLAGHTGTVHGVAFSPDGRTLATAGSDQTVRLWNLADPANPTTLDQPLAGDATTVHGVAFSPDGRVLATAGDSAVRFWDATDPAHPTPLGVLPGPTGSVNGVAFSADGHVLATISADRTWLWNLTDPAHPRLLGPPLTGHTSTVYGVAFSPDGHTLATAGADRTARIWRVPDDLLTGHTGPAYGVAWSRDGRTLATAGGDGTMRLWDLSNPADPAPLGPALTGHTGPAYGVAWSRDGLTLATAGDDRTVRLWDVTDPALPVPGAILRGHEGTVYGVDFSPDGNTLATTSSDHTVRLWDLTDPAHPAPLGPALTEHTDWVTDVAFSPAGNTLATAGYDRTLRLWDVTDPAHPTPLGHPLTQHTSWINRVAFSPEGNTLATTGHDQSVLLWDVTDPAHPVVLGPPLPGHTSTVSGVAFSPDGNTLATVAYDHTVRLWDLTDPAHATPLGLPLTGHTENVFEVAFSPDGSTLATTSHDRTVRLWELDVARAAERICATTTNNLTPERWQQYVSADLPYRPPCP